MSELTIVMYHYVRPILGSEFPGIKGLEFEGFKRQINFLIKHFNIVTTEQVITACVAGKKLPKNACWLTFDDGYKDHYNYVLPELIKRKLHGAFFPPRVAIETNSMLDVNSIHHILSCAHDVEELVVNLNDKCEAYGISKSSLTEFYKQFAVASRFDKPDTIYVKRMLQHVLPEDIRNEITSELFKSYVGVSQSEFSKKLYMNLDEVSQLVSSGMYVGSHGSMHYWLNRISREQQKKDIQDSLAFLESVGASTNSWVMCYPYGAFNDDTLSILKKFGAAIGVTTEVRKADLLVDSRYKLPRFDTNDFPQ